MRILAVSDEVADHLWSSEGRQERRVRHLTRRQRPPRPVDGLMPPAPIAALADGGPAHQGFEAFQRLVSALQPRLFLHGPAAPVVRRTEYRDGATRVVTVFDHHFLELEPSVGPAAGRG